MNNRKLIKSLFLFVTVFMLFSVVSFAEETPATTPPSGWVKEDGHWYFYNPKSHVMEKNKIVGNSKGGYYYVGTDGIRVDDETTNLAVAFVRANTKANQSANEKLNACVKVFVKKYKFKSIGYVEDANASQMRGYANEFFTKKKGCCFSHAAAVVYVARVLGYQDTRVSFGTISGHYKKDKKLKSNHGWAEVKKLTREKRVKKIKKGRKTRKKTYYVTSKQYKIYDLTFKRRTPKKKLTDVTNREYAYKLKKKKRFYLVLQNGTATWK